MSQWTHKCNSLMSQFLFPPRTWVSPEYYPKISNCARLCSRRCFINTWPRMWDILWPYHPECPQLQRMWGYWGVLEFSSFRAYFEGRSSSAGWGSTALLFCHIWHPASLICPFWTSYCPLIPQRKMYQKESWKLESPVSWLMWGAFKMNEKPMKGSPIDNKLSSLMSEASCRSSLSLGQGHNVTFHWQSPYLILDWRNLAMN